MAQVEGDPTTRFIEGIRPAVLDWAFLGFQVALIGVGVWEEGRRSDLLLGLVLVLAAALGRRWAWPPSAWGGISLVLYALTLASLLPPVFLGLPIYLLARRGALAFASTSGLASLWFFHGMEVVLPVQALLLGTILFLWDQAEARWTRDHDRMRQRLYHMEQVEQGLLREGRRAERMSRLAERQRMAEALHDHLGHELTAAHLAVRAQGPLLDRGDLDRLRQTQALALQRLDSAIQELRTTVDIYEPQEAGDLQGLLPLFQDFAYPIHLDAFPGTLILPAYQTALLESAIKEALTNILRHAVPTRVQVRLEKAGRVLRLHMENDGLGQEDRPGRGHGLRYLRRRLEALGGSLNTYGVAGIFTFVLTLPLEEARP